MAVEWRERGAIVGGWEGRWEVGSGVCNVGCGKWGVERYGVLGGVGCGEV